jgi:CDP-diglyceride synthetase
VEERPFKGRVEASPRKRASAPAFLKQSRPASRHTDRQCSHETVQMEPLMWVRKYSRLWFRFILILVCGAMAFWGVRNGQRWTPLLAFVIYVVAGMLIMPKLPNPIPQQMTLRGVLVFIAWFVRFLGIVAALGCVFILVSRTFLSNPLPYWATAIVFLIWGAWACGCLWLAQWISNKASTTNPTQVLDFGLPTANHDKK